MTQPCIHYYAEYGIMAGNSLYSWMEHISDGKYEASD